MSAQNMSRKRPAPGAEPIGYSQQMPQASAQYANALGPQLSDDQFLQWGQTAQAQNSFPDPSLFDATANESAYTGGHAAPSNQLTRRPINQIATRPNMNGGQWLPEPVSAASAGNGAWEDDLEELEQKAQIAKREAQTKRKSIPPFVLKLRSFLDDGKNGDLIRWTDDSKSFVVLDEDEFAKKLIPELFKHNNYASFVRQLNMYGFHKKVGLSDNSMRASERKAKSPSEYSNPYFREGYPDLMWLIQKPKNVTASGKAKVRTKSEGDNNEDADEGNDEIGPETRARPRPQLTLGDNDNNMNVETLQSVQRELAAIRHQQAQISKMIASIKREHEQLYGQAATFQDQHTRHENSINAILTFLATVYNRSLSGQEANPGITGIFAGGMPQSSQTGSVVDVGDYNFGQFTGLDDINGRPIRKPPLLLTDGQSRAQTMSPKSSGSPYVRQSRRSSQMQRSSSPPNIRQIEELPDIGSSAAGPSGTGSKPFAKNGRQSQQDMMSMIQRANARNASPQTPVADFNDVLHDLENSRGNTPLSTSQRENVLRMINNSANQSGDNALINATPPSGPANYGRQLASTKADLDALAKMQAMQDQSVEKLTNLLQPLSPSGSIPGLGDGQNLPPPPIDIEDFLNHNEYFADLPSDGNGNYDFGAGGTNNEDTFNWDANNNDDDELFANVNARASPDAFGGGGKVFDDQNYPFNDTRPAGAGRVESVGSSEPTTPNPSSIVGDGFDDGPSTRSKGRKLSTVEEEGATKRRRRS